MKYYKYASFKTVDGSIVTIDSSEYVKKIVQYIIDYTEDSCPIYIVAVDLDEANILTWISNNRVQLEEISEAKYHALRRDSTHYQELRKQRKLERDLALKSNIVLFNGRYFDANDLSVNRMSSRLSLYNYIFNRHIGNGYPTHDAYAIYNDRVGWRDSDGIEVELSIKELAELMSKCIDSIEDIIKSY